MVSHYSILYTNGSIRTRAPKNFELQGQNTKDGPWTTVDVWSNEECWQGTEEGMYPVASPAAYQGYRLLMTDDNDEREGVVVISMGTFKLFSCGVVMGILGPPSF